MVDGVLLFSIFSNSSHIGSGFLRRRFFKQSMLDEWMMTAALQLGESYKL